MFQFVGNRKVAGEDGCLSKATTNSKCHYLVDLRLQASEQSQLNLI